MRFSGCFFLSGGFACLIVNQCACNVCAVDGSCVFWVCLDACVFARMSLFGYLFACQFVCLFGCLSAHVFV